MKTEWEIRTETIEEMPYASDHEIESEVIERLNHQDERDGMHYPDAYNTGSIFDY